MGILFILIMLNNIFVNFMDLEGNILCCFLSGSLGFKGLKKFLSYVV